ncbi:MAG TPA: hypothetical protein VK522_15210 [Pseudolabrys sp.]|nr:hypothetical protein [Pseudolabrys sp.]
MADDIDAELQAIKTLQETLGPLSSEVRARVIDYVFRVLGISGGAPAASLPPLAAVAPPVPIAIQPSSPLHATGDILSLKEEKGPTTGTQMIAVVAYYLAHLAPPHERKDFITTDEIQKYFVQAKYPMPGSLAQALVNAKNAGYLDFLEKGKYRLNSVGYNLVAHKMPQGKAASRQNARGKKKPAKRAKR